MGKNIYTEETAPAKTLLGPVVLKKSKARSAIAEAERARAIGNEVRWDVGMSCARPQGPSRCCRSLAGYPEEPF